MLGPGGWVIVATAALVMFGPKKLPELGRAAGKTLREFKQATQGMLDDDEREREMPKQTKVETPTDLKVAVSASETEAETKGSELKK